MKHIHFGAGNFGLGFAVALASRAGADTIVINRDAEEDAPRLDSIKDDVEISSALRNALLAASPRFFIKYLNRSSKDAVTSSILEVNFEKFYTFSSLDHQAMMEFALSERILVITTAIKFDSEINNIARYINPIIAERNNKSLRTYILAYENGFRTSQIVDKLDKRHARSRYVVALEATVDRICAATKSLKQDDGSRVVVVEAEKHAQLVIEDHQDASELFSELSKIEGDGVKFITTPYIDAYRAFKIHLLNAAHLFIASEAHYCGINTVNYYLTEDDVVLSTPSVRERRELSENLIRELQIGLIAMARMDKPLNKDYHTLIQELVSDDAIDEIMNRFSDVHDPVERVISRLKKPTAEKIETMSDFLSSFNDKVSAPVKAYVKATQYGPARITMAFLRISEIIARRAYIDRPRTRH